MDPERSTKAKNVVVSERQLILYVRGFVQVAYWLIAHVSFLMLLLLPTDNQRRMCGESGNLRIAPPREPMPKDCCHFEKGRQWLVDVGWQSEAEDDSHPIDRLDDYIYAIFCTTPLPAGYAFCSHCWLARFCRFPRGVVLFFDGVNLFISHGKCGVSVGWGGLWSQARIIASEVWWQWAL